MRQAILNPALARPAASYCIFALQLQQRERWATTKAGHVPAEPRPRLISVHFLSGVLSETHNTHTHEHLLLLPNMSCVCSTNRTALYRNSIIPPLHWIWITPAVQSFPESLHWVIGWVGHQVWFALVWFSLSTDPAPLFRA